MEDIMKKWILFLLIFPTLIINIFAQDSDFETLFNPLPHFLTNQEKDLMKDWGRNVLPTQPPTGPVRAVAEFEPMSAVLIRYPLGFPTAFVKTLAEESPVITIVASQTIKNQAISAYQNANVNMNNCSFMIANTDSYWTRDYGPWFAFDGNNQLCVIDFTYNRPRPNDNLIPGQFATYDTLSCYLMNINQTGGNYMNTGTGIAASTQIAYTENGNNSANVNSMMQNYLGINTYHVVQDPNNTYIDHIDCWGKFLAPDKVLIRSVPPSHAQYNAIEQTAQYFANAMTSYGRPFTVYRVSTPQNQPYTNSLILNNRVFVPIMGNASYDNQALQAYRQAMPGYTVIGVTGSSSNPWESTDALHCRTHEIADRRMLYINHTPLARDQELQDYYQINADLIPYSQGQIVADSTNVWFRINSSAYTSVPLTLVSGNSYQALIPAPALGDTIFYYIRSIDSNGKKNNHPYIGAPDPHFFVLSIDNLPPVINHTPVTNVNLNDFPLTLSCQVTDNQSVSQVQLEYYTTDSTQVTIIDMQENENNIWSVELNPAQSDLNQLHYRIVAKDVNNPANVSFYPENNWIFMQISTENQEIINYSTTLELNSVYPNPVRLNQNNSINIQFKSSECGMVSLQIYNIKGQKVSEKRIFSQTKENQKINIPLNNISSLSSGVYLIKLNAAGQHISQKFLIVK